MQILDALARHAHFARAADACGISQPAFSARIRNLETQLGVPLVRRGNRFMGFTGEGEIVLGWARRLLADADGLRQAVDEAKGALSGRLAIGAVPSALAYVASAPAKLRDAHPGLLIQINSLSSSQIHQGLADFSIDAGVTYLDHELPSGLTATALYEERYVLLAPSALAPRPSGAASWAEAARLPLTLLSPVMRNRRILNGVFQDAIGRTPSPVAETNAFTAVLSQVAKGELATIAPEALADTLPLPGVARLALTDPDVRTPIGLVIVERDPLPPAVRALRNVLAQSEDRRFGG